MKQLLYEIENKKAFERALALVENEIAAMRPQSVLLHFFCGDVGNRIDSDCEAFMSWIVKRVSTALPQAQMVGISSGGEIMQADMLEHCILLSAFLFRSSSAHVLPFHDIVGHEEETGAHLLEEVRRREDAKGVELLFTGRGIDSSSIYERLQECRERLPFFGGYAVEHDADCEPAFLVTADGIMHSGMIAIVYSGDGLHVNTGRTIGWKPLGNAFQVTAAEGRKLISVNGIPAYDFYNRLLRFPQDESFTDYAKEFPLMLLKGKMRLLRHPQEKYEDSSILLDGHVKVDDTICVSYGAPLEIVRKINDRCAKIHDFEPEAVLLYSCPGRKNYWGDLVSWEMEPFQKMAETGGACLDGQVMRNNQTGRVLEHRLTLLSIAMREGEKTGRDLPAIDVDDDILKGRMSVLHKMSTLVESTVEELQRANDELRRMAITDELTGLLNRRAIEQRIRTALEGTASTQGSIALVMVDIDYFKRVNDTFGHDTGDSALKGVSSILRAHVDDETHGAVGRWGGEEFLALLPYAEMDEAMELAETVRKAVFHHEFPTVKHLTVSLGVTCANANSDYQAIFSRVDQALYQAKQGGRNRVVGLP